MFKPIYFCAVALSLCSMQASYEVKFSKQNIPEKPSWLAEPKINTLWESHKTKTIDHHKSIRLNGVLKSFGIILTDPNKGANKETRVANYVVTKTLCFAVGEDQSVYYIFATFNEGNKKELSWTKEIYLK